MKKVKKVVVTQQEEAVVEQPVLAQAILEISRSMQTLSKNGLNRRAIEILVHHNCRSVGPRFQKSRPSIKIIAVVFDSLADWEKQYSNKQGRTQ